MQTNQDSMHRQAHLDELVAKWVHITFAPGEVPEGTKLGEGGGLFDEHLPGGGRIPGECSATLIAKHLGLNQDHRLAPLLAFTLATDEGPSQYTFDLAGVIKKFRSVHPDQTNAEKYEWVKVALDAYWEIVRDCETTEKVKDGLKRARDYKGLDFASSLRTCGLRRDGGHMAEKLHRMVDRASKEATPTTPNYIHPWDATAMVRMIASVYGDKIAMYWFNLPVVATRIEDDEYRFAEDIYEYNFHRVNVCRGIVAWGKTNNPQIGKAGRAQGARIVIQQTELGNIMIFADDKMISQEFMDVIVKAIRAKEPGDADNVWYYHTPARMLLNGSDSQPKPPTRQSLQQVADTVIATIREWCEKRR